MTATTDTSTTLPESVTRLLTQAATHDLHCIEAHRDETALRIALHLEAPREGLTLLSASGTRLPRCCEAPRSRSVSTAGR